MYVRTCRTLHGQVGGEKLTAAQTMSITSPDRPGLPDFSCETLKNMGMPGYEASLAAIRYIGLGVADYNF